MIYFAEKLQIKDTNTQVYVKTSKNENNQVSIIYFLYLLDVFAINNSFWLTKTETEKCLRATQQIWEKYNQNTSTLCGWRNTDWVNVGALHIKTKCSGCPAVSICLSLRHPLGQKMEVKARGEGAVQQVQGAVP